MIETSQRKDCITDTSESQQAITMVAGQVPPVTCLVCGGCDLAVFFELPRVPVNCIALWPTREEAARCTTGRIQLAFCRACGSITNIAFEPALLEYDVAYDNSLHFSPLFQAYAEQLVCYLATKYELRDKYIVEIGCGKGDFLAMLCNAGGNHGVGFDPTYVDGRVDIKVGKGVEIIRDYYSERYADRKADLICCRHVLEHIPEPHRFLHNIRQAIGKNRHTALFFEVPNALFTLRQLGIWDVIYEHVAYYSPVSLKTLFAKSGFDVLSMHEAFGGQYLCLEARSAVNAEGTIDSKLRPMLDLSLLEQCVSSFGDNYRNKVQQWGDRLRRIGDSGGRVVLWGAGAKGATFLNTFRDCEGLEYIVDVNPHKRGKFIPGTGQQVVSPDFLKGYKPDVVIVVNPNYSDEIRGQLEAMTLRPELLLI